MDKKQSIAGHHVSCSWGGMEQNQLFSNYNTGREEKEKQNGGMD